LHVTYIGKLVRTRYKIIENRADSNLKKNSHFNLNLI
jgi:hypothetical protein